MTLPEASHRDTPEKARVPMTSEDIEKKVREIILKQLNNVKPDQITPEARFIEDLGADSLDVVELVMAFEDGFKDEGLSEIPDEEAEKLTTVGSVMQYIEERTQR